MYFVRYEGATLTKQLHLRGVIVFNWMHREGQKLGKV